jgi:hypothetical protein
MHGSRRRAQAGDAGVDEVLRVHRGRRGRLERGVDHDAADRVQLAGQQVADVTARVGVDVLDERESAEGGLERLRGHVRRGRDRGRHDLGRDHRRLVVVGPRRQIAEAAEVDVAREHDDVLELLRHHEVEQALARLGVAVPLVEVDEAPAEAHRREHDLLGDELPDRLAHRQAVHQPALLLLAEQRAVVLGPAVAAGAGDVHAILVAAVLPGVEQPELGKVAPAERAVYLEVRPLRRRQAQRHMLVVGLIGGAAPQQPLRARDVVLGDLVGVVVLDLVVVPDEQPRAARVHRLQVLVALVQRVADPISVEGHRLLAALRADRAGRGALVDVIAEEHHQIEVLLHHVLVGRVVAVGVVLAVGRGEVQALGLGVAGRRGPGAADRAREFADREAVPVPGVGLEALDVDVHRVGEVRVGLDDIGGDDIGEVLVGRDLPGHRVRHGRHAAVPRVRRGRQPGPQDHAVGQRVARGDPEREGLAGDLRQELARRRRAARAARAIHPGRARLAPGRALALAVPAARRAAAAGVARCRGRQGLQQELPSIQPGDPLGCAHRWSGVYRSASDLDRSRRPRTPHDARAPRRGGDLTGPA